MLNYISSLPSTAFAEKWPRKIVVLGCTGSIGRSAMSVLEHMEGYFEVLALGGGRNVKLLAEQATRWRPKFLAVQDEAADKELKAALNGMSGLKGYAPEVLTGQEGYSALAALPEADLVLSGQSGAAGLRATYAAVKAGKVIALANKESLILAGDIIRKACKESGAALLPVDSEHNAIFQCLMGQNTRALPQKTEAVKLGGAYGFVPTQALKKIILTASGGPFLGRSAESLKSVTKKDALAHPTWNMGAQITINSSTLVNKGMEYVEACHLFGLPPAQVEVIVHPQSIIHSLVEFKDSSRLAQLGVPDMRIPISDCLGWPYRIDSGAAELDLTKTPLTFFKPDAEAFPALGYWREAYEQGRGMTVALNAANEVAVALFLDERISYTGITRLSRLVLDNWAEGAAPADIDAVLGMDAKARAMAVEFASRL